MPDGIPQNSSALNRAPGSDHLMDMQTAASPEITRAGARGAAGGPRRLRGHPNLTLLTVAWA